jgi:hypothetical protein
MIPCTEPIVDTDVNERDVTSPYTRGDGARAAEGQPFEAVVRVMQQVIEERRDSGRVSEEICPIFHRTVLPAHDEATHILPRSITAGSRAKSMRLASIRSWDITGFNRC